MRANYILIAEDDEDDRFLLTSAFREIDSNSELVFVVNGIELINHFRSYEEGSITDLPSLLIVDLNMPKKTGKEALSELARKEYFSAFPTIIFSTTGNEVEKKRCAEIGIDQYIVKPSSYGNLLEIVTRFQQMATAVS